MPSIDERIVGMAFENRVFEQRVAVTMTTLGKLDSSIKNLSSAKGLEDIEKSASKVKLQGPLTALDKLKAGFGAIGDGVSRGFGVISSAAERLNFSGAHKAVDGLQHKMGQLSAGSTFTDIEKASSRVTFDGITKAISNVSGQFSLLQGAASVAFGNITSQAAMKGAAFAKSFAFGPIKQGFEEYQTNLGSIQTILANTSDSGGNLKTVNAALDELNTYSDKTIYNFSEMAKNIGTFTAAGVQLKPATSAIKGIANLAALSGSNSQQASTAMYQLSQAISAGRVGLQDWNSVVNAGMGGAVFQKSLMRTAENMGALKKGAVEIDKATGKATVNGESFRNSIMAKPGQESWLTSDVLTNTLSQLTGDMSDAELAAKGFSTEQIKAIQTQAKLAQDAATQVKTLPQVFDVAKETIGSGWSATFRTIFGDFEESKKTFTQMSNFINGFINRTSDARNKMLDEWKKLGGRDDLLAGIKAAFSAITSVLKPIQDAFREVFPPTTGKQLSDMTKSFREFAESMKLDPNTADALKRTFAGIFAVFHIAKSIIGGVIGVIFDLFGALGKGGDGFLSFTGGIGDFLVALDKAITSGDGLKKFFEGLSGSLQKPVELIKKLAGYFSNLFQPSGQGMTFKQRAEELREFGKALTPAERLINKFKDVWAQLVDGFESAKSALEPWFSIFVDKISSLGQMIGTALSNLKFDDVMTGIQTGLFAGLLVMIKKLFGQGGGLIEEISGSVGAINKVLGGLTGNLEAMQKKIQAQVLLSIAGAVVALAGGIFILSTIDGDKLAKAMTAVAIGLGQLMGAMKIMSAGMGKFGTGALMLPVIAAGIIGLAFAVIILAGAMKIFATMSWEDIGKGLTGVAGSLGVVAGAMRLMPAGPAMVAQAGALLIVGLALNAIGTAVKVMASMKWEDLGRGLFGVVDALGIIALTMSMMPPNMLANAAALVVVSFALMTLAGAIKAMGSMDLGTLVKGIGGVMVALAGLGLAMIPWFIIAPSLIPAALGLFIVSGALVVLGKALEIIGGIGIVNLVKGLVAIGIALVELAVGMYLMIGTLPGALAMMAAAAALAVLAPTLGLLGTMSWGTIFKGLTAIALALTVIGVVGLIAAPALALLGIALIPLGLGFMLVAAAAKMFASAMAILSDTGQKGVAALLVAFTGFIAILPTIVISFIKGLLSIIEEVTKLAPRVIEALGKILEMVIQFVTDNAVKLAVAIGLLVDSIIMVVLQNAPKLQAAGITLLMNLLNGISQNIGQVTNKVSEIIVKFMDALRGKMPSLIEAGSNLLRKFLDGVGSRFGEIATSVGTLIVKFTQAVSSQANKIATAAGIMMGKFVAAVATFGPQMLLAGAQVILDLLAGIAQKGPELIKRGVAVAGKLMDGIASGLVNLADRGVKAIIAFLNGLEASIRANTDPLINAGIGVGDAIMDGMVKAFSKGGGLVRKALETVFNLMPGWVKKVLGIKSPSKVFHEIGMYTMQGYSNGISSMKPQIRKDTEDVGKYAAQGATKGVEDNQGEAFKATEALGSGMASRMRAILGIRSPSEVFRDIGMNVNHGFRDGLLGSKDEVISAFESMNSSLIDKIRDLRTQVQDGTKNLGDLNQQYADKMTEIAKMRSEKKPDKSAIADAVKESEELKKQIEAETVSVNQNGRALTAARDIRKTLTTSMKDEKAQLLGLKAEYEDITKKLETATGVLEKAQQDRQSAQDKYTSQYSAKPDVDQLVSDALAEADLTYAEREDKRRKAKEEADKRAKIDQVALYKQALQEQLIATTKYQETLQKLRALGLDDETYTKLLDKGLEGQDFASQLLAKGKAGIDEINKLNAEMLAKSTDLAKQAADNLYNAGISAAQGLVDGLTKRKGELEAAMTSLADVMVKAIKSKLKIKSPSRIFMEVGQFTVKGLEQGLRDTAGVEGAVANLGRTMTDAIASASEDMDASPVITPVLDLTQVRKDAKQLDSLSGSNVIPITAAASYGQASSASTEVSATKQAALEAAATAKPSVEFTQNNYSPETLDDVEIYRKTRNQMGQLKSALGVPA